MANDSSPNFYYTNRGDGTFEDVSWESAGMVNEHGESEGSKGLTVGDYNNDGRLDIFITNFVEQSNSLYENDGDNLFLDQTTTLGLDPVGFNYSGWGTKFFEFDNDGDVEVLVVNKNDRPAFLLNDGGNRRNWLAKSTQGGIGAKAVVTAEGRRRFFEVRGSDSYLSSNDMRIHVGLGESTSANVTIRWASGVEDRHEGVAADSFNRAAEGQELEETLTPGSSVERQ